MWQALTRTEQIASIIEESMSRPCLVFKHSTRCQISHIAKARLDDSIQILANNYSCYYLDLLSYRAVSDHIASTFHEHHESPQVLVIKNGEVVYVASHLDIRAGELLEEWS